MDHSILPERQKNRLLPLLIAALTLFGVTRADAQAPVASSGTDFIANLPFLYLDLNAEFLLTITATGDGNVTVYRNDMGTSETRFLPSGSVWHYRIPRSEIGYPVQEEGRSRRSVRIRSTVPVTVQAAHDGDYLTDSWVVPPVSDLGRVHRVMSIWSGSTSGSVVTVAATRPNTTVRITPSVPTPRGGAPGFSYGITLDSGEVWQIVPTTPEFNDLSGTRIEADQPVLVVGGHAGAQLEGRGAYNPMIEWMPPVEFWGSDFIGRTLPRRNRAIYKILANEDGTVLWVNNTPVDTLDAGESRRWYDPFPVYFHTSNPSVIAQFVDHDNDTLSVLFDGDPSMTILQPQSAWTTSYQWGTLSLPDRISLRQNDASRIPFEHWLMISADFSDGSFPILLDGRDVSTFLNATIGGTGYRIGWMQVDTGTHRLLADRPVALQAFGFNTYDAYAHPVGYPRPPLVDATGIVDTTCMESLAANIYIRNRSSEVVVIDSVLSGGERLSESPRGIEIGSRSEYRATYSLQLPTYGTYRDTVVLLVRDLRTGRTSIVESRVEVVRAEPRIRVEPQLVSFPVTTPATAPGQASATVTNVGVLPVEITGLNLPAEVTLLSPQLPFILNPDSTRELTLEWTPADYPGELQSRVSFSSEPCDVDETFELDGLSDVDREPVIEADTLFLPCPDTAPEHQFRIANGTRYRVDIDSVRLPASLEVIEIPRDVALESGEEFIGRVLWKITPDPVSTAVIEIFVNGRNEPVRLELVSVRRITAFSVLESVVDLGVVRDCPDDTTTLSLRVYNSGAGPIDDLDIWSVNRLIIPNTTISTIGPRDTAVISLEVGDDFTGPFTDTIIVHEPVCGTSDTVIVTGERRRPEIRPVDSSIVVRGILGCDFPKEIPILFENRGNGVGVITSAEIPSTMFTIVPTTFPKELAPGGRDSITVRIDPRTPGGGIDTLRVVTDGCLSPVPVEIRVVADSIAWRFSDTAISLRNLLPGEAATTITQIINLGERSIDVPTLTLSPEIPGLEVGLPDGVTSIPPGQGVEVQIRYLSDDPQRSSVRLLAAGTRCLDTLMLPVSLEPGRVDVLVSLEGEAGSVDQTIPVTLRMLPSHLLPRPVELEFTIAWPSKGLYLEGVAGDLLNLSDPPQGSLVVTQREVTVSYLGIPANGTIPGRLNLRLLLSDMLDWPVTISGRVTGRDTNGVEVRLRFVDDTVSIDEICELDGTRLISLRKGLYLTGLRPNPVVSDLWVDVYSTFENPIAGRLRIHDILGTVIREQDVELSPGPNSYEVDLSPFPKGQYRASIQTASGSVSGRVILQ